MSSAPAWLAFELSTKVITRLMLAAPEGTVPVLLRRSMFPPSIVESGPILTAESIFPDELMNSARTWAVSAP